MTTNNQLVPVIIDDVLLIDTLTGDRDILFSVVETAWNSARDRLRDFAQSPDFVAKMELAFGQGVNVSSLQEAWATGEVESPTIEIRPAAELNGARGAFAQATNRIYLSAKFLSQNADNPDIITDVMVEEFGHWVDGWIDDEEAAGDEGEIFSALVRGQNLSASELNAIKQENDLAIEYWEYLRHRLYFWHSTG